MEKILTIRVTKVYGVQTVYPACAQSQLFAEIAGTKTLTIETLERIRKLGYRFVENMEAGTIIAKLNSAA